jgi:hypothetical protein
MGRMLSMEGMHTTIKAETSIDPITKFYTRSLRATPHSHSRVLMI